MDQITDGAVARWMETGQISAAIGNLLQPGKPETLMDIPTLQKISEEVPRLDTVPSKWTQLDVAGKPPAKVKVTTALTTEWYGSEELVQLYGPPMSFNSTGIPSDINQMFVAGRFARDNMVLYEPTLNVFYDYEAETGLWKPKTEARLIVELGNALQEMLQNFSASGFFTSFL